MAAKTLLTPRPTSPTEGVHFVENFVGNGTITTNLVGQNMWTITASGNGGTHTYLTTVTDADPPFGGIRHVTDGTATNDGNALTMLAATAVFPNSEYGGGFAFRARVPTLAGNTLTGNSFYTGMHTSVSEAAPTDGISIQSVAGVLTLRADSADGSDATQAFAGGSTLTSGTTMVIDVAHDFEVHWTGENGNGGPRYVEAFCDGEPVAALTTDIDNDEAATAAWVHYVSAGNDTLEMDLQYFEYWQFMDWPDAAAV